MEQIKDFRLNSTPKVLLIACLVLVLLRALLTYCEWQHPGSRWRPVVWLDAETYKPTEVDNKKLRLYEFYAAWCTPCQRLERDVMSNDEIRQNIEKNFVALRVTDRLRENGRNSLLVSELLKKYRIFAFPTLVAVGGDGEPIQILVGNSSSLAVYRFLTRVLNDTANSPR